MKISMTLASLLAIFMYFAAISAPAYAGCTCADLDGDGVAETCICTDKIKSGAFLTPEFTK